MATTPRQRVRRRTSRLRVACSMSFSEVRSRSSSAHPVHTVLSCRLAALLPMCAPTPNPQVIHLMCPIRIHHSPPRRCVALRVSRLSLSAGASDDDEYDPEEDAMAHQDLKTAPGNTASAGSGQVGETGLAHKTAHVKRHRSDQREARSARDWREGQYGRDSGTSRPDRSPRRPQRADMPPDQRGAMPGREVGREDMRRADLEHGRERGEREHAARFCNDPQLAMPAAGALGSGQLQHRAFVVGVDGGMSWRDRTVLDRHFSQFGRVIDVFTPKGKSVAFVSFEANHQLERALDVPHVVSGCTLRVLRAETVSSAFHSKPSAAPGRCRAETS